MPKRNKSADKHTRPTRSVSLVASALPIRLLAGVAIIAAAALIVYYPSLSGGFIWDDKDIYVTNSRLIKAPDGLYRFWFTTQAVDYYPVSNSALWIEWRLWGMNTTGYHVTSLILHIVGTLLIWVVLRRLSVPGAFLAALIFAVHPVNVEVVAWISQRKDMMAMMFFLLSILWYLQYPSHHSNPSHHSYPSHFSYYWLSLLAFVLGMLSKGSIAILPVLLLGIIWWMREKKGTGPFSDRGPVPFFSDLLRISPFFAATVVLTAVHVWAQTHGLPEVIRKAGFTERLLGAGSVIWFYLYKAILPLNLAFVYPQWRIETGNPLWWLPLIAAAIVTAVLWWYRKGWSRPFLFAWGFFCVALVPVMGFTDVFYMRYSLVADHYQHIAIIGAIALASAGFGVLHQRAKASAHWATTAAAIAAVAALAFLGWRQSGLYIDEITLYRASLNINPNSSLAHTNLGAALEKAGRPQEAIEHYKQALLLDPESPEAHNNLGKMLFDAGQLREAVEHYQTALRVATDFPELYCNYGAALATAGQPQEAIDYYQKALRLNPYLSDAHNNLGNVLSDEGRLPEAIEQYETARQLKSDYPEVYNNLANALLKSGRLPEAINNYEQALRLKPDYTEAHNNLGVALIKIGRPQEAVEHCLQALKLKPDFAYSYYNLALAYAKLDRSAEAVAQARKGLELARSQGNTGLVKQIEDWLNTRPEAGGGK